MRAEVKSWQSGTQCVIEGGSPYLENSPSGRLAATPRVQRLLGVRAARGLAWRLSRSPKRDVIPGGSLGRVLIWNSWGDLPKPA